MCGQTAALIIAGISAAASAYGAYQRNDAMQEARERRERARMNALMRQADLDEERQQDFQRLVSETAGRDNLEEQQALAEQRRLERMQKLRGDTAEQRMAESLSPQSAADSAPSKLNNVVKQNLEARRAVADADLAERGQALAKLSSLGDALAAIGRERQQYYERLQNNRVMANMNANRLNLAVDTIQPEIDPGTALVGALGSGIAGVAGQYAGYQKGLGSGGGDPVPVSRANYQTRVN